MVGAFEGKAHTIYLAQNKWLSLIALIGKAVFVGKENGYRP